MKKHVNILGMKFKIKKVPNDSKKLLDNDGDSCYAVIAHVENCIYIGKGYSKHRIEHTLLHEIIHGIDAELQLGMSHKDIYRLASGLASSGIRVK